ncbi:MAG TPA: twin-arginine translocase TatA/TatE family subunit [Acidimicrobiia bacterium]
MPQIGPLEILVVFIVALIVFGPSKLPQIGRQVGRGFREFRKFQATLHDDIQDAFREDDEEPEETNLESHEPKPLEAGEADPDAPGPRGPDPGKPNPGKPTEPPPADTTA